MKVVKLIIYNGEPNWIKETLDKSIKGTLYVGKNLIQTIVLEEPSERDQKALGRRFVCVGCALRYNYEEARHVGNLLLCNNCEHEFHLALNKEVKQPA